MVWVGLEMGVGLGVRCKIVMSSKVDFDVCELLLRKALLDVAFSAHIEQKSIAGSVHRTTAMTKLI